MLVLSCLVVVAALLAPGLALAQGGVRITGYGEFAVARELGIQDRQIVDGDPEPIKSVDGVRLIAQTDQIEGRLCRRFGIRFVLDGPGADGAMPIIVRTRHPTMTRPGGTSGTGGRYEFLDRRGPAGLGRLYVRLPLGAGSGHMELRHHVRRAGAGRAELHGHGAARRRSAPARRLRRAYVVMPRGGQRPPSIQET